MRSIYGILFLSEKSCKYGNGIYIMKKCYHVIAVTFAVLSVFIGLCMDFDPAYVMGGRQKLLIYATPILVLFIEMVYQMNHTDRMEDKRLIQRRAYIDMFVIYLIAAATLLFLGSSFRRAFSERNIWEAEAFTKEHFELYCNLKPFKSIRMYMEAYRRHSMSIRVISVNILGNLAAFMPCAIFMPVIFKKMRKFRYFLLVVTGIVILAETIQFLTMVGQADVDDVILNVTGASILYALRPLIRYVEGKYADYYLTEQPITEN